LAALSAVGLSVAAAGSVSVPIGWQTLLLAAMTAVIGVPHGGLDHRFGRGVCHRWTGRWWPIVFAVGYLLIVTLVLVGWVIVPMATIGLFFVLSAIHFGDGESLPLAAVEGGMVIWVPFLARPEEAARLLAWVTPGRLSESIERAAVELRPLAWALAAFMIGRIIVLAWAGARDRSLRAAVEAFRLTAFAGLGARTGPVGGAGQPGSTIAGTGDCHHRLGSADRRGGCRNDSGSAMAVERGPYHGSRCCAGGFSRPQRDRGPACSSARDRGAT
jgi:hypothetical protein